MLPIFKFGLKATYKAYPLFNGQLNSGDCYTLLPSWKRKGKFLFHERRFMQLLLKSFVWTKCAQKCNNSLAQEFLFSGTVGTHDQIFVLSRRSRVLKWDLLFDERKGLTTTAISEIQRALTGTANYTKISALVCMYVCILLSFPVNEVRHVP
jgi:hypothetical protein